MQQETECESKKKNKVAPPLKIQNSILCMGEGISKVGEILDLGVEFDIVKIWFLVQLWRHETGTRQRCKWKELLKIILNFQKNQLKIKVAIKEKK